MNVTLSLQGGAAFDIEFSSGVTLKALCNDENVCGLIGDLIIKNIRAIGTALGIKIERGMQGRGNYPDVYTLSVSRGSRPEFSYSISEPEMEELMATMLAKLLRSTCIECKNEGGGALRLEWLCAQPVPLVPHEE
jgi:hypothetical protein